MTLRSSGRAALCLRGPALTLRRDGAGPAPAGAGCGSRRDVRPLSGLPLPFHRRSLALPLPVHHLSLAFHCLFAAFVLDVVAAFRCYQNIGLSTSIALATFRSALLSSLLVLLLLSPLLLLSFNPFGDFQRRGRFQGRRRPAFLRVSPHRPFSLYVSLRFAAFPRC